MKVPFQGMFLKFLCQAAEPFFFDFVGYIVRPAGTGGPRPWRILRDIGHVKLEFLHRLYGVLKLLLRFARESHNDIRKYGSLRNGLPDLPDDLPEPVERVFPVHPDQYFVIARLQWDMDLLAEIGIFRDDIDHLIRHIEGVRRGEVDPELLS